MAIVVHACRGGPPPGILDRDSGKREPAVVSNMLIASLQLQASVLPDLVVMLLAYGKPSVTKFCYVTQFVCP